MNFTSPGFLLLFATTACVTTGSGAAAPTTATEDLPTIVEQALPAVVLVIAKRKGGQLGYGAGVWVDTDTQRIFTSRHVVEGAERIKVMPYRPGRRSYYPMDGGLDRFLFENEAELRPATVLRSDAFTDLAILELRGPALPHHALIAARKVRAGDRVLALGHAQQTVWSFTSGIISALHSEVIQHDAALNPGNSGGALINERGELVGINWYRVVQGADGEGAEGMGFARPLALARTLAADEAGKSIVDLRDLHSAVLTCQRAMELASPEYLRCWDWPRYWRVFQQAIEKLCDRLELSAETRRAFRAEIDRLGGQEFWIHWYRDRFRLYLTGDLRLLPEPPGRLQGLPEAKAAAQSAWPRLVEQVKDAHVEENERNFRESGFDRRVKDMAGLQEQAKKGLRIEGVEHLPEDRAWVLQVGRNADGSEYRFSELYRKKGEAWLWFPGPPPRDLASLPEGWPPPAEAEERIVLQRQLTLMVMLIPELHSTIEEALRDALKKAKHPLGTH